MKRLLAYLIVTAIATVTALPCSAQDSGNGKEGKVALEYGADFWYYFNNSEYSASNDALSGTIHAVVARPTVGFSITQSPAIKHKVMAGVDFSHDMGTGSAWKDYTKELVLYYEASVTSDKGTFTGLSGAFPRKALEGYYSEAFYTDEYCFQDRVLEGVLLKWRASDFYAELGCDWMGKLGHERRERFQIMTAGQWEPKSWLSLGWTGSFYHYACSELSPNVVDNHTLQPWIKADVAGGTAWQELSARAGAILTYQRDRKQDDKTRFPAGCELMLKAKRWNVSLANTVYLGDDVIPLYNKVDLAGIPYGQNLYFGSEFYNKFYDMVEINWTPRIACFVELNIGAQLHFNKDGFLGWQQMLSLKVTL
ncbi:MAG: hypothetical protein IJS75_07225 [Bacteroidales bacterium]|nr:hypothetical protein [Bacteroidales bacterium]